MRNTTVYLKENVTYTEIQTQTHTHTHLHIHGRTRTHICKHSSKENKTL